MKKNIIKSTFIMLLLIFINCKTAKENKIVGNWKGISTNKSFSYMKSRYCEMEFTEEGKLFNINSDLERLENNKAVINDYKIIGDSIITTDSKGRRDGYLIEYISETKLILRWKLGDLNDFYYELNRVENR